MHGRSIGGQEILAFRIEQKQELFFVEPKHVGNKRQQAQRGTGLATFYISDVAAACPDFASRLRRRAE